ncbi:hypothetical protein UlMin_034487 [Ulmus minor]
MSSTGEGASSAAEPPKKKAKKETKASTRKRKEVEASPSKGKAVKASPSKAKASPRKAKASPSKAKASPSKAKATTSKGKQAEATGSKGKKKAESESKESVKEEDEGNGAGKTIIIEHCKQCNQFKTRALLVERGLKEAVPGITVLINPEKQRRGCFEIREEGGEIFISLLNMVRPFQPMRDLNMDQVIADIVDKMKE